MPKPLYARIRHPQEDGAEVGQRLDVVRHVRVGNPKDLQPVRRPMTFEASHESAPHPGPGHLFEIEAGCPGGRWMSGATRTPKVTYITHGEPDAADALRARIKHELGWHTRVPEHLQRVILDSLR